MVAGSAARAARRVRLAVPLAVGVRRLARAPRAARRAASRPARSRTSSRAIRTGPEAGRASPGAEALADQVRFEREWGALRAYAAERGIRLIGDLPIYVSDEGADLPCWPELFAHGEVAGAPPDALSATGQRWGNPLYDWPVHRATGYRWWRERFRRTFELVDLCRVDHFRGYVSYWAIPGAELDGEARALAAGPGSRALPRGRARSGPAAGHRRGPRAHHAAGLPAARRARPPRDGRAPVGVPPPPAQPASAREPSPQLRRVHEHARHRHRRRLVRGAQRAAAGCDRPRSRSAELGADRARVLVPRRAGDRPGAGRARARQRGADEPPGRDAGKLELAARARRARRPRSRAGYARLAETARTAS